MKRPYPIKIKGRLFKLIPKVVSPIPTTNRTVDRPDDLLMFFSTSGPKNAAPIPRKNIDRVNANWTFPSEDPMNEEMSLEKNEKAYTEPMQSVNSMLGTIALRIPLIFITKMYLLYLFFKDDKKLFPYFVLTNKIYFL